MRLLVCVCTRVHPEGLAGVNLTLVEDEDAATLTKTVKRNSSLQRQDMSTQLSTLPSRPFTLQ